MWKIPLSDISFDEREIDAVTNVLRSKWLTMGEVTQEFERAFADYLGVRHAFAVSNCTAALQLAYRVLGVVPGDEIIMPSLTFVATANAAIVEGAVPVFADITSENDLTVSPADIRSKITSRTRAITVMHYGGNPCDMDGIMAIAREHNLGVIEDCAHSPGATYHGRMTGTIGDVGCFSFFSNKNMTTGEGGMLTTDRDDLAERIRLLRSHGMTTPTLDRHKGHSFSYDVVDAGYNCRIDEMRSALGLVQLTKLTEANKRRRQVVDLYRELLADHRGLALPFAGRTEGSVFHLMPAVLGVESERQRFMTDMREAGVQTSIHYPPAHRFTYYQKNLAASGLGLPITERIAERLVTLPLYPSMTLADVEYVVATANQSLSLSAKASLVNVTE
jgi:dTDP-4-amino-4,6-dideoxygalactose transaminase